MLDSVAASAISPTRTMEAARKMRFKLPWLSLVIIGTFVLAALCADLITPADPLDRSIM